MLTSPHRFTTNESMRTDPLGIMREHFACLFSFIEARTSRLCVDEWMGIFSKTHLFLYSI